jgi:hypothetical protein
MSLVGNIAGKGFLPVPRLTLAPSSVTTGVRPRIYAKWTFLAKHRENGYQETLVNSLVRASHPRSNYDPVPSPPNSHFSRAQGMCTCIHETGGGFFEGMCRLENRPLLFATHPHPSIGELTSASLGISQQAARVRTGQVESRSSAPFARSSTYVRCVRP